MSTLTKKMNSNLTLHPEEFNSTPFYDPITGGFEDCLKEHREAAELEREIKRSVVVEDQAPDFHDPFAWLED